MDTTVLFNNIFTTLPPEIVHCIFEYTSRDHTSAAGFFNWAVRLELLAPPPICFCRSIAKRDLFEEAIYAGDLPLLRYILATRPGAYNLPSLDSEPCKWQITQHNVHTWLYIFTLVDVQSPLFAGTDVHARREVIFTRLRSWVSLLSVCSDPIYILECLRRSRYANQNNSAFADFEGVAMNANMVILKHIYENGYLNELTGTAADLFLRLSLLHGWSEAITYLLTLTTHEIRFATWTSDDIRRINANKLIACTMNALTSLPKDTCATCRDWWLPRLGWWGMVGVYQHHNKQTDIHNSPTKDTDPKTLMTPVLYTSLSSLYICKAVIDAVRHNDTNVLEYVNQWFPHVRPCSRTVLTIIRTNDVELLRNIERWFPGSTGKMKWREVVREIDQYLSEQRTKPKVERRSVVELLKLLQECFAKQSTVIPVGLRMFKNALAVQDFAVLEWCLRRGDVLQFRPRTLNMWKEMIAQEPGMESVMSTLEEYLQIWKEDREEDSRSDELGVFWMMVEQ